MEIYTSPQPSGESTAPHPSPVVCYHCGEDCGADPILFEDKPFCCAGCKMVYEILQANDLCRYYEIESHAGVSLRGRRQEQFAWLDDPEVAARILDFNDGKIARVALSLPQIHCASCVWLLENLYKLAPGILRSRVQFLRKELDLTFDPSHTSLRQIVELLHSIGYTPELNLASLDKQKRPYDRRLIYQLGVAGFAFGNIMLLSFPEYLGLSEEEMAFRQWFGYLNILLAVPVLIYAGRDYLVSAWNSLRTRNPGIDLPLALGMVMLFGRSTWEILTGAGPGFMDSLAGLVFFLLIGKWYQSITYHRISFDRDYRSYFPIAAVKVLPDGSEHTVALQKLQVGDTIRLRHGDIIPADGVLKQGHSAIDYAFVTGESDLVDRGPGDQVFAGGRHNGGAVEVVLTKPVSQSYLTRLWNDQAFTREKFAGTSRLADKAGRRFTLAVLLVAFGTLAYWFPVDPGKAVLAFTAVLIVACPCALALNIPFTLGNAVRILSQRGFYLRNTQVVEALHDIDAVVLDKTGTLTWGAKGSLRYEGATLDERAQSCLKALVRQSSHPVSRTLDAFLADVSPAGPLEEFEEITGKGIQGRVAGRRLRLGSPSFIFGADSADLPDAAATPGTVCLEIDGTFTGSFHRQSNLREGVKEVLSYFRSIGPTWLLTGDDDRDRQLLQQFFDEKNDSSDWFRPGQSPSDKLQFIKNLQARGYRVLFLGDGLNDAGALRQSDVGIAISENAGHFSPGCDAILDADKLKLLPDMLRYGHAAIRAVYITWIFALLYNVIGLSYAVTGQLTPLVAAVLMPASSLTIVLIGVGLSSWFARKLDATKPSPIIS